MLQATLLHPLLQGQHHFHFLLWNVFLQKH